MIEVTLQKNVYSPGEILEAVVHWEFAVDPQMLEVAILWHTEGIGEKDSSIVEFRMITAQTHRGQETVRFTLPHEPLSFEGKHITLLWALEARSKEEFSTKGFEILRNSQKIILRSLESTPKPFST